MEMGGTLLNHGGLLTLINSTLAASRAMNGGGIANQDGTVTLAQTLLTACIGIDEGGGIFTDGGQVVIVNSQVVGSNGGFFGGGIAILHGGTVTLLHSTLRGNQAKSAGALDIPPQGTVFISDSTIADNGGDILNGSGISNRGTLTILNSTITRNTGGIAGGIVNAGQLFIGNTTIADNQSINRKIGGIVSQAGSATVLLNTILARNTKTDSPGPPADVQPADCSGMVTSLGTNVIGDPTGCTITLQPRDLTGDPGLDTFTDDGTPGNGHFPLLRTSQAIDAGNDAVCPRTDQLGQRRVDIRRVGTSICDIGAIEFPGKHARPHDEDLAATGQASQ
jgi:hypothetical protein